MDTHECQPLYLEIREFYEGLHMKVEQQIPMLLVERSALNEAMEGEKHVKAAICLILSLAHLLHLTYNLILLQGHHHLPETRGLCLSEEQTVTTVYYSHFRKQLHCVLYPPHIVFKSEIFPFRC